jgi:hypothetical protein
MKSSLWDVSALQIIIETNAEIIFELEKILKEAVRPE